mgnify:CR=1 FL=1
MKNKRENIKSIIEIIDNTYADEKTFLRYSSPYELFVAVILSAQCTDKRVNEITPSLFAVANTPQSMIELGGERLAEIIKSGGMYNMDELLTLPGVGRKTANVILSNIYNADAIAVDTHVFRVSNRTGLADERTPYATEAALMKVIDKSMWSAMHYKLILHGRTVCTARSPKCAVCPVNPYCAYYQNLNKRK